MRPFGFLTWRIMAAWKRTLYPTVVAQVLSIAGFMFVMPFLPFYIRQLGVTDEARVILWTGILTSAPAVALAIMAPVWGALADRYGRKLMVVRAMFCGALVLFLMGRAQSVHMLLVARVLQGLLTGTITASTALVASAAPSRRSGYALGMIQAAVFFGASVGPLVGGEFVEAFGIRAGCMVAAAILFGGGLLVLFVVREQPTTRTSKEYAGESLSFGKILLTGGFLAAVFTVMTVRFANTASQPVYPLFVEMIRGPGEGLFSLTGKIFCVAAATSAIAAGLFGTISDRVGHKRMLIVFCLLTGVSSSLNLFANSVAALFVFRALFGFSVAGVMPAANAIIRRVTHEGNAGKAYGLTTAIASLGWAAGPIVGAHVAASQGLRAPFLLTGVVLAGAAAITALFVPSVDADEDAPNGGESSSAE